MESQVKWDMYREERSQTEEERREEAWHSGTAISADFCWILSANCWIFSGRRGGKAAETENLRDDSAGSFCVE